ncbi:hypothetical protein CANCADRAFT_11392, partial [Tortispora caseinolytica NRRL Y-17796]
KRYAQDDSSWATKPLELMTQRDWRILNDTYHISIKGENIPHPARTWQETGLPSQLLDCINTSSFKEPTPIQRAAIPTAMTGSDVLGLAETGSGKTLAFVLPLLAHILDLPRITTATAQDGPYAVILSPTRELALQIEEEASKFSSFLDFRCLSIVGGHSMEDQVAKLRQGIEIIIATPGRLNDLLDNRLIVLNQCCFIVLDEADRMISMGFDVQVQAVLSHLPKEPPFSKRRQAMMFSATMPPAIEALTAKYLTNPAIITIGATSSAVDTVEQRVEIVESENDRKDRLLRILRQPRYRPPVIVFVNTKPYCDSIADFLKASNFKIATMHGDKSQSQREKALDDLRTGKINILVATDIAGRGIDVPNVSLVVNFEMPHNIENYTHRIGRTGRAGQRGTAITFIDKRDKNVVRDLYRIISRSNSSKISTEFRRFE